MLCSSLAACWGVKGNLCGLLGRSKEHPDRRWPQLCLLLLLPCTETAPSWACSGVPSPPQLSLSLGTSWVAVTWGPPASPLPSGQVPAGISPGVWEEAWSAPAPCPALGIAWEDRTTLSLSKWGQWRHPVGWRAGRGGEAHLSTGQVLQCSASAKPAPKSHEHQENCVNQLHGSHFLISHPKAVQKSITQKKNP